MKATRSVPLDSTLRLLLAAQAAVLAQRHIPAPRDPAAHLARQFEDVFGQSDSTVNPH